MPLPPGNMRLRLCVPADTYAPDDVTAVHLVWVEYSGGCLLGLERRHLEHAGGSGGDGGNGTIATNGVVRLVSAAN